MDLENPGGWQIWRPLTGHLTHASAEHLWLNVGLFLLLGALREHRVGTRRFLLEVSLMALAVACGVRLLHDDWTSYRGLSGVVYGLIPLCFLRPQHPLGPVLIAALAGKSALEWQHGGWLLQPDSLQATLGVAYLPGSHVAGLVAGLLIVAAERQRAGSGAPIHKSGAARIPAVAAGESDSLENTILNR